MSYSGRGDPLPGSSNPTVQPFAVPPANVVEPMETGGSAAIPTHQRGDGHVLRGSITNQGRKCRERKFTGISKFDSQLEI